MPKHPMQPIEIDPHGVARFKSNEIVSYLVLHRVIDMNKIALLKCSRDDHQQFAQLIGYSVSGYASLSYADPVIVSLAEHQEEALGSKANVKAEMEFCAPDSLMEYLSTNGWITAGSEQAVRNVITAFGVSQFSAGRDHMKNKVSDVLADEDMLSAF